jgi:hypothetical protein
MSEWRKLNSISDEQFEEEAPDLEEPRSGAAPGL